MANIPRHVEHGVAAAAFEPQAGHPNGETMTQSGEQAWRAVAGEPTGPLYIRPELRVESPNAGDDGTSARAGFNDVLAAYNAMASEFALARKAVERAHRDYDAARDSVRRLLDGIDQAVGARTRLEHDVLETLGTRAAEVRHAVEALQAAQVQVEKLRHRLKEMTGELQAALSESEAAAAL